MSGEKFKILAGMLALRRFTGAELAEATGVNSHTVNSWIQRSARAGRFVVEDGREPVKRGRPRIVWRVREDEVETIRTEIAQLGALPGTQRDLSSAEEAAEAFADTDVRDGIRFHLVRAGRTDDAADRIREIEKALDWFEHEQERLEEWEAIGFPCPSVVNAEMQDFSQWFAGLDMCVDKLGVDHKLHSVNGFADWFEMAIEAWFDPNGPSVDAFAPLRFALPDAGDLRGSLSRNLKVLVETAEKVATVPRDRLLCALLMVLPRLTHSEAYLSLCDVLEDIGYEAVGEAIEDRMDAAHHSPASQQFIYQALAGLKQCPPLLQNKRIGAWVDGLLTHRLYSPIYIVNLLLCLENRRQADPSRIMSDKAVEIGYFLERLDQPDAEWAALNRGIEHLSPYLRASAERFVETATGKSRRLELLKGMDLADQFSQLFGLEPVPAQ